MKRTLLSVAGLLLLAAPLALQAQLSGDGFDYVTNQDGSITITNYTGLSGIVTIPSTINGLTVTVIGNGKQAIATNIALTNVIIPDSVLEIADYAFYTNYYLTNVTFGQNVVGIGEESFYECTNLTSVTLPDSVLTVGYYAFYYCYSMTNCTLGTNLVTIDDYAFYADEELQQITIPASVVSINEGAFYYCTNMTNLVINGAPQIGYESFYEDYQLHNAFIAGGTIEESAFEYCSNLTALSLGDVTSIGYYAFYDCNMTNLIIPASVNTIDEYAFYYDAMTNLTILGAPDIGEYAFYDDYNLQNASIYGGTLGYESFYYNTNLTNVTIGDGPTTIGTYAIYDNTNLISITMGTNCSSIGYYAFYEDYNLKTAIVSGNIDIYAFYGDTNLANLTVNNGAIPDYCFEEAPHLTNVTINNSSIGSGAFYECSDLTNVTIGSGVGDIGDDAFYDCDLQNATIESGSLGYAAFYECEELTNVTFGPGVTSIGEYAFYYTKIPSLVVPANVTNIAEGAFEDSLYLTNATVDSAIVGDYAFYECYYLTNITFGRNVSFLGNDALYDDTNLAGIYFQGDAPPAGSTPFNYITNGTTTVYYYTDTGGWSSSYYGLPTMGLAPTALQVALSPTAARTNGASWQLNNDGVLETNGVTTLMDLAPGIYTISFTPIPGWVTPSNETVTITNGKTATAAGFYILSNTVASNGLVLQTNGYGIIHHGAWPSVLVDGKKYTVTAVPDKNNVFVSWSGGTNQPYAVLSTSANFSFTMEPGMLLAANFETNTFLASSGTYSGIFYSSAGVTEDTAGMLKGFMVRDNGSYSGTILYDGGSHGISGSFNSIGLASNHIARPSNQGGTIQVLLSLDTSDTPSEVVGVISGTNGTGTNAVAWSASLTAYLATNNLPSDEYTMLIGPDTGTTNTPPTYSPGGDGYELISIHKGAASVTGTLADGTTVSEAVPVSQGSYIPIYASLYNNKGLLLGWIDLNTNAGFNSSLTWIRPAAKKGLYPDGFTNMLNVNNILVSAWTNAATTLNVFTGVSLVDVVGSTNGMTNYSVSSTISGQISGPGVTGSINLKTGQFKVEIGSGKDKITGYGAVVLDTNGVPAAADGYYLNSTNSLGIELTQ